jgi:hypothetical protein
MPLPYIVDKAVALTDGTNTASITWDTWFSEPQQTDDWVLIFALNDVGNTALGIDAGWTEEIGAAPNNSGSRCGVFSQRNTGTDITPPTITGANAAWRLVALLIRGAGATLLDAASARQDIANTTSLTSNSITTTNADCLILRAFGMDGAGMTVPNGIVAPIVTVDRGSDVEGQIGLDELLIWYQNLRTAGAAGTFDFTRSLNDGGTGYTLGIIGSAAGKAMPEIDTTGAIRSLVEFTAPATPETWTDISTIRNSLAGVDTAALTSVSASTLTHAAFPSEIYGSTRTVSLTPPATENRFYGAYTDLAAATDFQGLISFYFSPSIGPARQYPEGSCLYLEDSVGNYKLWALVPKNVSARGHYFLVNLETRAALSESVTEMDFSDVVRLGVGWRKAGTGTAGATIRFGRFYAITGPMIFAGGSDINPVTPAFIANALAGLGLVAPAFLSAGSQVVLKHPIRIGNTISTYSRWLGQGIAIPATGDRDYPGFVPPDSSISITIDMETGDEIRTAASVLAAATTQPLTFDATTSAGASYSLGGAIVGCAVTLATNAPINSGVIAVCPKIMAKGCSVIGSRILETLATDAAINFDTSGGSLEDTTIDLSGVTCDYHVELGTAVESIDLTDANLLGTPAVKNLNILRTTGTVTITLAQGQAQPTYDSAGATVVFDQPVLSTSWTNAALADGTSVLVRNVTTSTTIDYDVTSGGTGYTIAMLPGVDYTVGDTIEIRISRKVLKTYFEPRTIVISTTAGGGELVAVTDLASCPVCDALDMDGEDYDAKFELDYIDDELDIETAGTWETGELMTWWKWQMTLQTPMEQFWDAWSVQRDGSFLNNVATLSSLIDTTETGDSVETTGRRIFRSDGARPIKGPTTGGGAIDLSWREPVTVVATGSGVLPSDVTAIASATRTELGTELARIDADISSRLAAADYDDAAAAAAATKAALEDDAAHLGRLHRLAGLKAGEPLTVTPTSRVVGDISQTIAGDGTTLTTVTLD